MRSNLKNDANLRIFYEKILSLQQIFVKDTDMERLGHNTGLVLEGGGMRGVFTSGVLDALMRHEMYFPYVVAVSAGACNGLSYMSRQPRRARFSNIDMLRRYGYLSLKHLLVKGSIFDPNILYERFPAEIAPFDYDTYAHNPAPFEMVTTKCLTGQAEYLSEKHDPRRLTSIAKASSSLPYVAQVTKVDGIPMLDGGIVDSIPVLRSVSQGHSFNVVVMTRNMGFRSTERDMKIPPIIYKEYPRLRVALSHRVEVYNEQLEMVERMERWGEILVIRPQRKMEVGRTCSDIAKLERLYEEGYEEGDKFCKNYLL